MGGVAAASQRGHAIAANNLTLGLNTVSASPPGDPEQWRSGMRDRLDIRRREVRRELNVRALAFLPCVLAGIVVGPVVAGWTSAWHGAGAGVFVFAWSLAISSLGFVRSLNRLKAIGQLVDWLDSLHGKPLETFWDSPLREECEALAQQKE
jgi:hypothetical protein